MAEFDSFRKSNNVDEAGIRLAPAPLSGGDTHVLPEVRQSFVLQPTLEIEKPAEQQAELSTANDFQPKKKDIDKHWKRGRRGRNLLVGLIMLLVSAVVVLPFVLGATGVKTEFLPFKYVPTQFNVVGNFIDAFARTAEAGVSSPVAAEIWKTMVPDIVLAFGLIFVLINIVKAVTGICGAIKPRRYTVCAMIYFIAVAAVFLVALLGSASVGLEKIDFMADFIHGWKTSEFFTLLVTSAGNLLIAALCTLITPQRRGY